MENEIRINFEPVTNWYASQIKCNPTRHSAQPFAYHSAFEFFAFNTNVAIMEMLTSKFYSSITKKKDETLDH